jgi:hypothetical protein
MKGKGSSQRRNGGSKWSHVYVLCPGQWSLIGISFIRSRIRIRIGMKIRIRIRINVMRIRNTAPS